MDTVSYTHLGIGSMEIFGSYLSRDCKLTGESINVVILDTVVAVSYTHLILRIL